MAQMVRKQIYIQKRQQTTLKRLARLRGVSEAELIREAIDRQIRDAAARPAHPDPQAWERAHKFMLALRAQGPIPNRPRQWTRAQLYAERLNRYGSHSH